MTADEALAIAYLTAVVRTDLLNVEESALVTLAAEVRRLRDVLIDHMAEFHPPRRTLMTTGTDHLGHMWGPASYNCLRCHAEVGSRGAWSPCANYRAVGS